MDSAEEERPLLFVDVDGVIALFGFSGTEDGPPGVFHWIDGVAHCIPEDAGSRLERLSERFELVWASGWEQKANEHLPFILDLPFQDLPCLEFGGQAVFGSSHWKVDAIRAYSRDRAAAWIDDNHGDANRLWALDREAPTLLVETSCATGMTDEHVDELLSWAAGLASAATTA